MYFTATFPYVLLIVLFIRGVTLEGSLQGILFFIRPDFKALGQAKVGTNNWCVDSLSQEIWSEYAQISPSLLSPLGCPPSRGSPRNKPSPSLPVQRFCCWLTHYVCSVPKCCQSIWLSVFLSMATSNTSFYALLLKIFPSPCNMCPKILKLLHFMLTKLSRLWTFSNTFYCLAIWC